MLRGCSRGKLIKSVRPAEDVRICLFNSAQKQIACTTTNDLGEYALIVPPNKYLAELTLHSGKAYRLSQAFQFRRLRQPNPEDRLERAEQCVSEHGPDDEPAKLGWRWVRQQWQPDRVRNRFVCSGVQLRY
jgi:hypothetical protein